MWEPYLLFLHAAFYLCPKTRTLDQTCGLKIVWAQKPSERDTFKCMLSLPTTLGSRQRVLTQYFMKKGLLPEVN